MRQIKMTKSITHHSEILDKYLQEIGREELITALEEVELAQKIQAWDQKSLETLCKAHLRFVVSVAKQYQHQWLELPDLINEGNLWLIKAAKRFDETRGFKFISYAVYWIRQSILDALTKVWRHIRLPANTVLLANKIYKAKNKLAQELERNPSNEELAHVLKMDAKKVIDAHIHVVSLDKPLGNDGNDTALWDTLSSDGFGPPDAKFEMEWFKDELYRSLNTLSGMQKEIVEHFFGLNNKEELTMKEMAVKYDYTKERIRQIKGKAINKLQKTNISKLLKQYL